MSLDEDLAAEGPPEVEFHTGVAARMARKRVAAGALFRDQQGRILMVDPTYRPWWDIPGGVCETNEPPVDTCRREVSEELGIDLPVGRLLVIDWVPEQGVWHDALLFVFDGGVLDPDQIARFHLADDEIRSVRFVPLEEAISHLRPSAARRLAASVAALDEPGPVYLQFGRGTEVSV